MTRENAIKIIKEFIKGICLDLVDQEALKTLIPELNESEDESIRKELIGMINEYTNWAHKKEYITYLEKQKENPWSEEDEAIVKTMCEEGNLKPSERAWLMNLKNRRWKKSLHISETCKENPDSFTDEDKRINRAIFKALSKKDAMDVLLAEGIQVSDALAYLEKQKEIPTNEEMLRTLRAEYEKGVADTIAKYEQKEPKPVEWKWPNLSNCIKNCKKCYGKCLYRKEPYEEQKPAEPSDEELQRHQNKLYDFKVFAARQAREHHISFVHDFEWNNFCAELLSYFNEKQKPFNVCEQCPYYKDCPDYNEQKPACEGDFKWTSQDERCRSKLIEILELADIKYPSTKDSRDELWEWLKELPMKFPNKNAFIAGILDNDDELSQTEEILGVDGNPTCYKQQPKQEWSKEDSSKIGTLSAIISDCAFYKDALDENGDLKGEYAELDAWLSELPERFNLQPKNEWSEEDENIIEGMIVDYKGEIEHLSNSMIDEQAKPIYQKRIDFLSKLKSHCPQPYNNDAQKKIDDAIYLIEHYASHGGDKNLMKNVISGLKSLRQQLKQVISEDTEALMAKLVNLLKSYRIGEETAISLANRIADTYGAQRYMDGLCDGEKLHWKPSEEQITNLINIRNYVAQGSGYWGEVLDSLIEDLNKLK